MDGSVYDKFITMDAAAKRLKVTREEMDQLAVARHMRVGKDRRGRAAVFLEDVEATSSRTRFGRWSRTRRQQITGGGRALHRSGRRSGRSAGRAVRRRLPPPGLLASRNHAGMTTRTGTG